MRINHQLAMRNTVKPFNIREGRWEIVEHSPLLDCSITGSGRFVLLVGTASVMRAVCNDLAWRRETGAEYYFET
jgi:hypothetical protein